MTCINAKNKQLNFSKLLVQLTALTWWLQFHRKTRVQLATPLSILFQFVRHFKWHEGMSQEIPQTKVLTKSVKTWVVSQVVTMVDRWGNFILLLTEPENMVVVVKWSLFEKKTLISGLSLVLRTFAVSFVFVWQRIPFGENVFGKKNRIRNWRKENFWKKILWFGFVNNLWTKLSTARHVEQSSNLFFSDKVRTQ